MEMLLKTISFENEELNGMPLFYRRIFYNNITNIIEDHKIIKYNPSLQTHLMRSEFPRRDISKTVNHKLFNINEK